jgi:hypothetical protein
MAWGNWLTRRSPCILPGMTIIIFLQRLFIAAALLVFGSKFAFAATSFDNLSQADVDAIAKEWSSNSMLHTVMPPSSMGDVFGFQVGLVAGITKTPEIERLVKENAPTAEANPAPHAGILAAVSVPFGISGELVVLPEFKTQDVSYKQMSAAIKWTITDVVETPIPINIAARAFVSNSDFTFRQTVTGTTLDVEYDGRVSGLQFLVSPKLVPVFEPYAGIGLLRAQGDLKASGTGIFDIASSTQMSSKPSTTQLILGIEAKLLIMRLGLEYSTAFDTSNLTAKLAFGF